MPDTNLPHALNSYDDKSQLTADYDLQDIIALNLNRAVPLALDIGAHLIAGMDVPPPGTIGENL